MIQSSLFSFEKPPQLTTPLSLFTDENKKKILKLVRARRTQQGLKTTSNFSEFNKIRSEEFKKLNETEKRAWSEYADTVNEAALAAWENLPDDDLLLR